MGKGSNTERELVNRAWEKGWAALRAPGSGSVDRPSPDVVLIRQHYDREYGVYEKKHYKEAIAIELKNYPSGTATFREKEIKELKEWAKRAGAKPYIGIKPDMRKHNQWYFDQPSGLTDSYGFTKEHQETAPGLDELLE